MIEIKYVFALITTEELPLADFSGAGQWVMVNHKRRGWELPGGGVHEGESFELKKLSSKDPVIDEVRWFSKPPLKLAWGEQELKEILDLFN